MHIYRFRLVGWGGVYHRSLERYCGQSRGGRLTWFNMRCSPFWWFDKGLNIHLPPGIRFRRKQCFTDASHTRDSPLQPSLYLWMINFDAAIPFSWYSWYRSVQKNHFLFCTFLCNFSGRVILDSANVLNQFGAILKNHTSRISCDISDIHSFASVFHP